MSGPKARKKAAKKAARRPMDLPSADMSTATLCDAGCEYLAALRGLMTAQRGKDRACLMLTNLSVVIQALSMRLSTLSFIERTVSAQDDDEGTPEEDREAVALSLADLFTPGEVDEAVQPFMMEAVDDYRAAYRTATGFRVRLYCDLLDYVFQGCDTLDQAVGNLAAIARRTRPDAMKRFARSQADVARKLGEPRGTVAAREKRLVEQPLKKTGAKGTALLGGVRGEKTREACRKAQQGNTNRADGEARKRQARDGD